MSARPPRQSSSARRAAATRAKQRAAMRRSLATIGLPLVLVLIGAAVFVSRVVPRTHAATPTTAIPTTAASATIAAASASASVAGAPIDGVQCGAAEGQVQHVHQHFDVVVNGQDFTPPASVGIFAERTSSPNTPCLYWVHTHTPDGVIHVESPANDTVVLGAFLDIWSVSPVDRTLLDRIRANPPDRVIVDGKPYTGDYRAIPLRSHTLITFEYGSPEVPQRPFDFQAAGLPT